MNLLKAGFGRVNVNPMLGIDIAGYFVERKADGILDDLEINALALECGGKKTVFLCIDNCGIPRAVADKFRKHISERTGVAFDAIYMAETHTHTAPTIDGSVNGELEKEYLRFAIRRAADAVQFALDDLSDAKMGYGIGNAPGVAFVRRYLMKDGSIKTNPGVDNPDIVEPIGEVDERVNVLRFDREGKETLVLVNFGNHPDVVGGCKISADWPGFLRRNVEKAIDNTKCIFFNGAQGDINHVNVHPRGGDLNGMFMDFDDVSRGYPHSEHIGRVVTAGVLQVYAKVKYVDVDSIEYLQRDIKVASNMPRPEDMPEAHRINDLHNAGRDAELPYKGMMLTTVVAEAERMVRLEHGPDAFEMPLSAVRVGPVGFVGIPGEPFNGIGRALKETEGFELILPTCCTNGYEGYFPMQDSYDEGGYEARSSSFKAGVAEFIIEEGKKLLGEIKG
jgi:hypothetical protein